MTYILRHQGPRAQQSTMNGGLWLKESSWRKKKELSQGWKRKRTVADVSTEEEAPVIWLWAESRRERYPQMTRHADKWRSSWIGHRLQTWSLLTFTSFPDLRPLSCSPLEAASSDEHKSKFPKAWMIFHVLCFYGFQTPFDCFFFFKYTVSKIEQSKKKNDSKAIFQRPRPLQYTWCYILNYTKTWMCM